jgi:lysophospholipase L1-like esterase
MRMAMTAGCRVQRLPAASVVLAVVMSLGALPLGAQAQNGSSNPLSDAEALALFTNAANLMESTALVVPGLGRAAAPIVENVRQSVSSMQGGLGAQNGGLNYQVLTSIRAYLALADSMPKPQPFPQEGRNQFMELREAADRIDTNFRLLLEQKERALRNPDRDNLNRYAEVNERVQRPAPERPRVVFLGDSITDGWRLNEYFPERDFINRGISGQITSQMLGRLQADVISLRPAAVHLLAGTNDLARNVPLRAIQDNITMIHDLAQAKGIRVILASILPVSDHHKEQNPAWEQTRRRSPDRIRMLNEWMKGFCALRGCTYLDYHSPMVDQSGQLKAELADDGLHPNSMGYRIMAPLALESIGRVTAESQQRRRR